ncbi:hypothetical protein J2T13_000197 [Paenibacillus sp. DS2015]
MTRLDARLTAITYMAGIPMTARLTTLTCANTTVKGR